MKKLIFILLTLLTVPLTAFAISLDELQNNSNKYVNIYDTIDGTMYTDITSIKCIRYAPPYYTLQAKEYFIYYNFNLIGELTNTYNYDYNQSCISLMEKILESNPLCSEEEFIKSISDETDKNSGITYTRTNINYYNLDGLYKSSSNNIYTQKLDFLSNGYKMANFIFEKYYTTKFWITK